MADSIGTRLPMLSANSVKSPNGTLKFPLFAEAATLYETRANANVSPGATVTSERSSVASNAMNPVLGNGSKDSGAPLASAKLFPAKMYGFVVPVLTASLN